MRSVSYYTLTTLLACLFACTGQKESSISPKDSFVLSGRMEFLNIETGCWILVAKDGKRYEPTGDKVQGLFTNGLVTTVRARLVSGVASVCQAGILVEVLEILDPMEQ